MPSSSNCLGLTLMTPTRVVFISKIPSVNTEIACVSRATYIYMCDGGGRKEEREEGGWKGRCGHKYQAHYLANALHTQVHVLYMYAVTPTLPTHPPTCTTYPPIIQLCRPMQSHMAPHLHTHCSHLYTPTPLAPSHTLSHPHTPTNLISLIQLCKLLHLIFLQSCRHLFDVMCEDVDDLVQHCEHGLWDDLEHL